VKQELDGQRSQNVCYEEVSVVSSRFYWSVRKDKKHKECTSVCRTEEKWAAGNRKEFDGERYMD